MHDEPEEDKWKPKSKADQDKEGLQESLTAHAQQFNRLQYQNFLSSCLFMIGGHWDRVMEEAEKGLQLCESFNYAPLKPEAEKMMVEHSARCPFPVI